jgi:LemA protein
MPMTAAMDSVDLAVLVFAGAFLLFLLWVILIYNKLVRLRNRADAVWADIDVQLERRHDLVGNLVEVVKGYATHERTTFEEVAEARARAAAAESQEDRAGAENALSGALGRLLVTAEAYPDLEAEERFQDLQEELVRLEDTIVMARQAYNLTVQAYNNNVQTVPTNIAAWLTGFRSRAFLSTLASEMDVPKVGFSVITAA